MPFTFKATGGLIVNTRSVKTLCKYSVVFLLLFMASCGEDDPRLPDTEYFPLRTGFYQVYAVEETNYTANNTATTVFYELKTEVVDSFYNDIGTFTYVIHRYTRETQADVWAFKDSWSARLTPNSVIVSEGNIAYVRLLFSGVGARWNGNMLNTLGTDEYTIASTGKPYQLPDGETINDCIQVIQHDDFDILERDQRQEVYARNIGLIYKKSVVLTYCNNSQNCPVGTEYVIGGTAYEQVLKSYGRH